MKRHHLVGVRDVRYALVLLVCSGVLPGCAVQPHQVSPAGRVGSDYVYRAPVRPAAAPVAVSVAPPAPAPRKAVVAAAAPPKVTVAAPVVAPRPASRPGDAFQSLPGAVYANGQATVPAPAATAPVVAFAAPVEPPVVMSDAPRLQPASLKQPSPIAVVREDALLASSFAFGDVEAQAVRFAGGRCSENIYRLAWAAAELFHVQPAFVAALIEAESGCRNDAVSVAGARGLMQLLPEAGAREGYRFMHGADHKPTLAELRDPATNIQLGVAYLGALQDHFYFVQSPSARLVLTIAAYNCGPDFIDQRLPETAAAWSAEEAAKWVSHRTPAETRAFVVTVSEKAALYANAATAARNAGLTGGKKNLSP